MRGELACGCCEVNGVLGDYIEHNGEEVAGASGEDEEVPNGMVEEEAVPCVEDAACGVCEAA